MMGTGCRLVLGALASVLVPALAFAGEGAQKGGLPQLDPSSFASQLFWLLIHFVILYVVMAKLVLPSLARRMEMRQSKLAADLNDAEQKQQEASAAKVANEQSLAKARAEAQKLRDSTLATAMAEQAKAEQALAAELSVKLRAADDRIAEARTAMQGRMRDVASEIAADMLVKVAKLSADKATLDGAVAKAAGSVQKEAA